MTSGATVSRTRVLVVEEDAVARADHASTLSLAGHDVVTAATIEDAWRSANERRPDVVVLDCKLPDGSGLDLLRRWRETASMQHVPVVVLTPLPGAMDVEAASRAGADAFVVQRPSTDALVRYVGHVLRDGEVARAPTQQVRWRAPLTLVYLRGAHPRVPELHEHEGVFQARCQRCLRGSPPLGRDAMEAESRAIGLGWAAGDDGWDCPVCIERAKTMRPKRPVLRRRSEPTPERP